MLNSRIPALAFWIDYILRKEEDDGFPVSKQPDVFRAVAYIISKGHSFSRFIQHSHPLFSEGGRPVGNTPEFDHILFAMGLFAIAVVGMLSVRHPSDEMQIRPLVYELGAIHAQRHR